MPVYAKFRAKNSAAILFLVVSYRPEREMTSSCLRLSLLLLGLYIVIT